MLAGVPHVRSDDRSIHYLDQGRGVPVVLVHSSGLSSRQWSRLSARLVEQYRVVAPDLLGAGASDPVPRDEPFHYSQDVRALDAVLDEVGERFHLVGHSYGGLVALTSARERSDRVLSVSVFEPVVFGVLWSKNDRAGIADLEDYDADGSFFDDRTGGDEAWLERFIDWWQGKGAWRALAEPAKSAFSAVGRKVFQEVRSLTADRTPHDAYAALSMPALVMSGERSPLAARRAADILAETVPNAELVRFEGAGHMAPLTHGQAVNDRIIAHLRSAV
jgi:pimeloyl-ACP methyl ester carboxylesterase